MLGVIQFAGATGVFPQNIVNVFEGLFEHGDQVEKSKWWWRQVKCRGRAHRKGGASLAVCRMGLATSIGNPLGIMLKQARGGECKSIRMQGHRARMNEGFN
ncbi:MAG: hypothetical protein WCR20_13170 [Verrucomicrobiota bacterium]